MANRKRENHVSDLWIVLEGGCLKCDGDLEVISVKGCKIFTEEYTYLGEYAITVWTTKPVDRFASQGVVVRQCTSCGAEFEAWLGRGGGWTLA